MIQIRETRIYHKIIGAFDFKRRCIERSMYDIKVPRERVFPMLSNGSRDTLMSYTDRYMQRRLKSNAPVIRTESRETDPNT